MRFSRSLVLDLTSNGEIEDGTAELAWHCRHGTQMRSEAAGRDSSRGDDRDA